MTPLAQALLPLYRGYLRRLEEMAARIGADAALREPTTRDEEGRLVRDESGFVLRFDVADSRSGETFEVHGARPDDPAEREVRVGTLPFVLTAGNWEELTLRCVFSRTPEGEDLAALAELLHGWAVLAAHGAFAGGQGEGEPGKWSGRLHSAAVRVQAPDVVATLDLGTSPPDALDALAEALAGFGRDRAPLARVVLGATRQEDS